MKKIKIKQFTNIRVNIILLFLILSIVSTSCARQNPYRITEDQVMGTIVFENGEIFKCPYYAFISNNQLLKYDSSLTQVYLNHRGSGSAGSLGLGFSENLSDNDTLEIYQVLENYQTDYFMIISPSKTDVLLATASNPSSLDGLIEYAELEDLFRKNCNRKKWKMIEARLPSCMGYNERKRAFFRAETPEYPKNWIKRINKFNIKRQKKSVQEAYKKRKK